MEDATIGNMATPQAPPPGEITTDDLVMMIGENVITARQNGKLLQWMQGQLQQAQEASLAGQSKLQSALSRISELEGQIATKAEQGDVNLNIIASLQKRIRDLENQVYQTAQERDKAIRDMVAIEDTVSGLEVDVACRTKERDALRSELDALKTAPETQDAGTWDAPAPAAKPKKDKK
jgi:chromosome segregation ATPase